MPSLPPCCQLAASAPRIGDTDFSGSRSWPTPTSRDWKDGGNPDVNVPLNSLLGRVVWLTSWPTPTATDGESSARHGYMIKGHSGTTLTDAANLAGWPTPTAGNADGSQAAKDASPTGKRPNGSKATVALPAIARLALGPIPNGSTAAMANGGQLSPILSLWLMGLPFSWVLAAPLKVSRGRKC